MPYTRGGRPSYSRPRKAASSRSARSGVSRRSYTAAGLLLASRRTEAKYVDQNVDFPFDNATASSTGVLLLNGMGQGSASYNRIGRKTLLKKIIFSYQIQPYNLPANSDRLKVALVWDRTPIGALPNVDAIFASTPASGVTTTDIDSEPNLSNQTRFKILHHKIYNVALVDGAQQVLRMNMDANDLVFRKNYNVSLHTDWADSVATGISNIREGALYLVVLSQGASAAGQTWMCHVTSRCVISDV